MKGILVVVAFASVVACTSEVTEPPSTDAKEQTSAEPVLQEKAPPPPVEPAKLAPASTNPLYSPP